MSGTDNFYGKTKEIGYYDTALTDEELEYTYKLPFIKRISNRIKLKHIIKWQTH